MGTPPIAERSRARPSADELAWREFIHDQLRSLRTGLMIVGVLVVAALGIAVWGLLTAQAARDERAAVSAARARSVVRRIERVEAELARVPTAADLARIQDRVQAAQVAASEARHASAALEARVRQLEQRVGRLATQTPTPTPTPTR